MDPMPFLLAIDAGTTAVKVTLFDERGQMVASSLQEYSLLTPTEDCVELPAEAYWQNSVAGIRDVLAQQGLLPEDILAVGVTSQGETFIPVGDAGQPLRNAIVWLDNRAGVEAQAIASTFDLDGFYEITGLPEIIPTWPACKIIWLRRHEPDVFAQAQKYLLVEDYLLFRLSGHYATEGGVCTSTGYFDIRTGRWWREMLDHIGLRVEQLPELLRSGEVVGPVAEGAAAETGLSSRTLVVTGAMDQIAGAVGAGNIVPGIVSETTGTALVLAATVNEPTYDPQNRLPCYYHAVPGRYLLLPYCQTAGMTFRWFRDQFGQGQSYDQLTALAAGVPPGSEGLVMLPHLTGSTSPHFDPRAKGVFYGIVLGHTRAHFVRAILESVAFMLRENVELLVELGVDVGELVSLGGGARSKLWLQIKADVTELPLRAAQCEEAASLGVAMLAGVGIGLFRDVEDACRQLTQTGDRMDPNSEHHLLYENAYRRYLRLYASLETVFGC
jgi:sugar (pentulose or hexulose) kinase